MDKLVVSKGIEMTSLDIAEVTEKRHADVMRDIRSETKELGEGIAQRIFALGTYRDKNNQERPCYKFGKNGAMQLALKYDAKTRYRVIEHIEDLEEQKKPKTKLEVMQMTINELSQHDERISNLEENMRINGTQEFQIREMANKKVVSVLGGKDSKAYKEMSGKAFARFWRDFKRHFMIPRYGELPKLKFKEGIEFIDVWQPDTSTRLKINGLNKQISIKHK